MVVLVLALNPPPLLNYSLYTVQPRLNQYSVKMFVIESVQDYFMMTTF